MEIQPISVGFYFWLLTIFCSLTLNLLIRDEKKVIESMPVYCHNHLTSKLTWFKQNCCLWYSLYRTVKLSYFECLILPAGHEYHKISPLISFFIVLSILYQQSVGDLWNCNKIQSIDLYYMFLMSCYTNAHDWRCSAKTETSLWCVLLHKKDALSYSLCPVVYGL